MHVILGATGHVGSAVAAALLAAGEPVTGVTRDAGGADELRHRGASIAVADVGDRAALRAAFARGRRLFLLNPPAAPSADTDREERRTLAAILAALDGADLERIVAESTYGAQAGEHNGDLGVLYEMEQALAAQPVPASIIRAGYYMSNWDAALSTARAEGVVNTFLPVDFALPMVAPADLGSVAASLLTKPVPRGGITHVEGPRRYTAADVAEAFSRSLGRPVAAVAVPRDQWIATFRALGFSDTAARSYAGMTAATLDGGFPEVAAAVCGTVALEAYIATLCKQ